MSPNMEYTDALQVRFGCFSASIDLEYILVCREPHCHLLLNVIIRCCCLSRDILPIDTKSFLDVFGFFLHFFCISVEMFCLKPWLRVVAHTHLAQKGGFCPNLSFFLPTNSCFSHAGWSYNYHPNEGIGHSN